MLNFKLQPTATKVFEHSSGIRIELPVYGDLLGNEYDVIEEYNSREMAWNKRLLAVAQAIANDKNLGLWEVTQLMNQAEFSGSPEEQYSILGKHVTEFLDVLSSKPSEQLRSYHVVSALLERVEKVSIETLKGLPRNFLRQLEDFIQEEQEAANKDYITYNDLSARFAVQSQELILLKAIAEEAEKITQSKGMKRSDLSELEKKLLAWRIPAKVKVEQKSPESATEDTSKQLQVIEAAQ